MKVKEEKKEQRRQRGDKDKMKSKDRKRCEERTIKIKEKWQRRGLKIGTGKVKENKIKKGREGMKQV